MNRRKGLQLMRTPGTWKFVCLTLLLGVLLSGCGVTRYIPGAGSGGTSSGGYKTSGKSAGGKGGTYRPYTVMGQTYYPLGSAEGYSETGVASWYGSDFHGKKTANGERYDMYRMTAAHRILPMNTQVTVHNLDNGRTTTVRVNDRGPFVNNRVIDLSYAAAKELGVVGPGTARVYLQTVAGQRLQYVGPFYVQYGAFVVRENATRLQQRLIGRGYRGTRVSQGDVHGTTYWRVQLGAFATLQEAEAQRSRLVSESPGCFIIAD